MTKQQQEALYLLKDKPDSEINYSYIPSLSEEQIAEFYRPKDKQLVAVRLDVDVLEWLEGSDLIIPRESITFCEL